MDVQSTPQHRRTFIYVLVASDPATVFAEMTAISMLTLRRTNPDAYILAALDRPTADLQSTALDLIRDIADDILVHDLDEDLGPIHASRFIKLGLREKLDGELWVLDGDTVIPREIPPIDFGNHAVAVVENIAPEVTQPCYDFAAKMNWSFPEPYMNGGFTAIQDHPDAYSLYEKALDIFAMTSADKLYSDQLCINFAAQQTGIALKFVSEKYNAQIAIKANSVTKPYIFHYFSGALEKEGERTVLYRLTWHLKNTGQIDETVLNTFLETKSPWINPNSTREFLALGRPFSAVLAWIRKRLP